MDIKLKSNRRVGFLTAGILIILFSFLFRAMYPVFEKKAEAYYKDEFHSDIFLQSLMTNNYVLYSNLMEKMTGSKKEEYYLGTERMTMSKDKAIEEAGDFDFSDNSYDLYRSLLEITKGSIKTWTDQFQTHFAENLDYCIIDQQSGEKIKNTGKRIEDLARAEDRTAISEEYQYYVVMAYDDKGNIQDITVKSDYPDDLLKSVKKIGEINILAAASQRSYGYSNEIIDYSHGENSDEIIRSVYTFQNPKNVTIVYAFTPAQKKAVMEKGIGGIGAYSFSREGYMAYQNIGVPEIFRIFMFSMLLIALGLTFWKKYELHKEKIFHGSAELFVIGGLYLFSEAPDIVVRLIFITNSQKMLNTLTAYFYKIPDFLFSSLIKSINFILICVIFALWYCCVTGISDILRLGPLEYIKERSLFYRFWGRIKVVVRRWMDELLNADLNKDILRRLKRIVIFNFILLAAISLMWFIGWIALVIYSFIVYLMLKKYAINIQKQYQRLLSMTGSIAEGNLNSRMDEKLGIFESYKEQLLKIQEGFKRAVDEEVKSQKMKTELITNVSHDLKTPLTAITTYIELLKNENTTLEERREYLAVLERKSVRLKLLIDDLFEVSKANSGNVSINPVDLDICNLMRQVYLEYEDKIEQAGLIVRYRMPEEKIILILDSQKTYRILENLFSNIIKYAMSGTRVYIDGIKTDTGIRIEMKNISAIELNVAPAELTERFVRGDSSRNTEGSGLGLAIAKSFTELQGGKLNIEVDGDLYKVVLEW